MGATLCRVIVLTSWLLASPLLAVSHVWAQMGAGREFGPDYYDGSSNAVIRGVVETVEPNAYSCHWGATEVTLKTGKDNYVVQVGPSAFLSQNHFSIAKGDELSVRGFKFTCQGNAFLVAREVTKEGKTLTLRDAQGVPAWAGRGKGWSQTASWGNVRGRLCCGCRCRCW